MQKKMNTSKVEEQEIFDGFKEIYKDFPCGDISHLESPDFLINTGDEKIGVEITRLFPDKSPGEGGSKGMKEEKYRENFGKELLEKIEPLFEDKISLYISYYSKIPLNDSILSSCVYEIEKHKQGNNLPISFYHPDYYSGIISINIEKSCSDTSSIRYTSSYVPSDIEKELILQIVNSKEAKLEDQYRDKKYNQYWLLIAEGKGISDSANVINVEKIDSKFDKVFVYRIWKKELLILKG